MNHMPDELNAAQQGSRWMGLANCPQEFLSFFQVHTAYGYQPKGLECLSDSFRDSSTGAKFDLLTDLRVVNSRLQLTFEGFLFEGRIVNVSAPVPDTVRQSWDQGSRTWFSASRQVSCCPTRLGGLCACWSPGMNDSDFSFKMWTYA